MSKSKKKNVEVNKNKLIKFNSWSLKVYSVITSECLCVTVISLLYLYSQTKWATIFLVLELQRFLNDWIHDVENLGHLRKLLWFKDSGLFLISKSYTDLHKDPQSFLDLNSNPETWVEKIYPWLAQLVATRPEFCFHLIHQEYMVCHRLQN